MSVFSKRELEYLTGERPLACKLGRLATIGADGLPHVVPVGWSLGPDAATVHVNGRNNAASKKFRDVIATGVAALVIDDVLPPWRPRGVEIRGRATTVGDTIVIHPARVVSWGMDILD
ncbi:PPOX class F420-dependent oxidoreductase [Sinosporangium siamense]|uniref:PPOX class F420-dependent oxidoreductase n=1 Tax=Sinosporangium siamense TaxID=1367973 RepID=A0A919V6J4_9ACTN|nr:PPOX class F420-dependent oxidoreductase [Sinosporangium siamense]GII94125.1 PPOX class F420-dependent oxidoreductase [Sinosporangium siamense]